MNAQNAAACLKALTAVGFRFPPTVTEDTVRIWTDVLRDVPVEAARLAVAALAREVEDFPTTFSFRERAMRIQRELDAQRRADAPHHCSCGDVGFVDGPTGTRPCERCNVAAHGRWRDGEYRAKRRTAAPLSSDEAADGRLRLAALRESLKAAG